MHRTTICDERTEIDRRDVGEKMGGAGGEGTEGDEGSYCTCKSLAHLTKRRSSRTVMLTRDSGLFMVGTRLVSRGGRIESFVRPDRFSCQLSRWKLRHS